MLSVLLSQFLKITVNQEHSYWPNMSCGWEYDVKWHYCVHSMGSLMPKSKLHQPIRCVSNFIGMNWLPSWSLRVWAAPLMLVNKTKTGLAQTFTDWNSCMKLLSVTSNWANQIFRCLLNVKLWGFQQLLQQQNAVVHCTAQRFFLFCFFLVLLLIKTLFVKIRDTSSNAETV